VGARRAEPLEFFPIGAHGLLIERSNQFGIQHIVAPVHLALAVGAHRRFSTLPARSTLDTFHPLQGVSQSLAEFAWGKFGQVGVGANAGGMAFAGLAGQ
jgi:hypothetical protein